MVVFIVLFCFCCCLFGTLSSLPDPIFQTPKVSLRMLQKVGAWPSSRNGGQGAGRVGHRGHLGRKEPCLMELGWVGNCQAGEVERKSGPQWAMGAGA